MLSKSTIKQNMVPEKSVEFMLDRHLEEQNVKPPKKVCWYMGGRPASLAPHSSCGEQQIVCRVYAVVWEVVSAEKTQYWKCSSRYGMKAINESNKKGT